MTVAAVARKAGPFINDKSTAIVGPFPFTFKIFALTDVKVQRSASTDLSGISETLTYGTDYTVTADLSAQDTNPGGSITLTGTISTGSGTLLQPNYALTIISNVPYSQLTTLTNYDRFMPEVLNEVHDRAVANIQQLEEYLDRAVMVPSTSTQTPEELIASLQKAAKTAETAAKNYADAAQQSANLAAQYANKTANVVNQVLEEGNTQVARVDAEGDSQAVRLADLVDSATGVANEKVIATGNTQVNRVIQAGETVLTRNQLKCLYGAINYPSDQASSATVTLPASVSYVVGLNHLRVSVNGLVLYKGIQYEEVGTDMHESTQIKLLMALKATDTLEAWVVPTGGTFNEATGEVVPDEGAECQYGVWTVTTTVTAESSISLPVTYIVGKNHLCMSVNGLLLTPTTNFTEVGATGDKSTSIVIKFDLKVGDEVCAWTVPYDRGTASETETQIKALQDALADLSQKVVYKDESSAS